MSHQETSCDSPLFLESVVKKERNSIEEQEEEESGNDEKYNLCCHLQVFSGKNEMKKA